MQDKLYQYEGIWLTRGLIDIPNEIARWNLGDGESEVLSWAQSQRVCGSC
ncbi:MAG: hypothetical protein ABIP75_12625 [Pyrinomonadaceae bacterium]